MKRSQIIRIVYKEFDDAGNAIDGIGIDTADEGIYVSFETNADYLQHGPIARQNVARALQKRGIAYDSVASIEFKSNENGWYSQEVATY